MRLFIFVLIPFLNINICFAQANPIAWEMNNNAKSLIIKKDYYEAIDLLNKAIAIDSSIYQIFQNRAEAYIKTENDSLAKIDLDKAIFLAPNEHELYYMRGRILRDDNNYKKAFDDFNNAVLISIKNDDESDRYLYYFNRGGMYLKFKNYSKAISDYDSIEKNYPSFNPIYQNRGIAYYKLKKYEKACSDWYIAQSYEYEKAGEYFNERCKTYSLKKHLKEAEFIYGNDKIEEYISENLFYPPHCKVSGYEGKIYIEYLVDETGRTFGKKVESLAHPDLINQALSVVLSTDEKFKPATLDGKVIPTIHKINVTYKSDENPDFEKYKHTAIELFGKNDYAGADSLLNKYLCFHYNDKEAIKKYIEIKEILNDTSDIEKYKYAAGKTKNEPSYFAPQKIFRSEKNGIKAIYLAYGLDNYLSIEKEFFYDKELKVCNRQNLSIYRLSYWYESLNSFDSIFRDYTKEGKLCHTGAYKNGLKEGVFITYYPNSEILSAEGKYKNGKLNGLWKFYHENGQIKDEIVIQGDHFKIINSYSEKGETIIKVGTGYWTFTIKSWNGENDIYVEGNFLNGFKNGEWSIRNDEKVLIEELYEKGKFIKGKSYISKKTENTISPVITSWIFNNSELIRMESLIPENESVKQLYPFISKFGSEN